MPTSRKELRNKILLFCILDVAVLSVGHATKISALVWSALAAFAIIVLFIPREKVFPVLLFFIPWATVMRLNTTSFSFYSIVIPVFFAAMVLFNAKGDEQVILDCKTLLITVSIVFLTLAAKLYWGYSFEMSYVMFILMLVFIPTYVKNFLSRLSFEECTIFYAFGIISASIASRILMAYPHMNQFIKVYEWEAVSLTRLSGFYGDSNFYSAQISASIGCLLVIAANKRRGQAVFYGILTLALIYFGLSSVSKSFIITLLIVLSIWLISFLSSTVTLSNKLAVLLCFAVLVTFVLTSSIFVDEIEMYLTRFGMADNAKNLTTGRTILWQEYFLFIRDNIAALLFGQGLSSALVYVGGVARSSHNVIIQAMYQLGFLGIISGIVWLNNLGKLIKSSGRRRVSASTRLFIAVFVFAFFLQWMSLDMLFFNDFYYLIVLFFLGKEYFVSQADRKNAVEPNDLNRRGTFA